MDSALISGLLNAGSVTRLAGIRRADGALFFRLCANAGSGKVQ
jgi:hypothetical protein